jgi:hypothetical protein
MSYDLIKAGQAAGNIGAMLSLAVLVRKAALGGWRYVRGNCRPFMKTFEVSDRFWSRRDRNPIFSKWQ